MEKLELDGITIYLFPPHPGRREKINSNFYFTLLCGAAKGFVALKPFEAPQRSVRIKILS